MKGLLIISSLTGAVGIIISLLLFLYGIVVLISGKLKFPKPFLEGKTARIASLFFIGQLLIAFFFWAILYESYDWGYTDKNLQSSVGMAVIFILFPIIGFLCCKAYAKSKKL